MVNKVASIHSSMDMEDIIIYINYIDNSTCLHMTLLGVLWCRQRQMQTIAHYLPFPVLRMHYFVHSGVVLLGYPGRGADTDSLNLLLLGRGRGLVWFTRPRLYSI